MTKYYLKFDTMKDIIQTPKNSSLEDVLRTVCRSEEIAWIQLRRNEKKLLNDINTDKDGQLRFHVLGENGKRKKRIQTREEKIFVLANDCLTGDPTVHDLSLNQDINSICSNGCRIARCMKEFFIYKKCYRDTLHSTLLAKSLHQRLWDDSPYLLKQLPGIGMVTAKALHLAGINSFKSMEEADPRRIEIITGRKYPFGNHIKESLLSLPPKVEMKVEEVECRRRGKSKLLITLTRSLQSITSNKRHYADMFVGSEEDNMILFHEKIRVEEFASPYSATLLVSNPQQGKLTVKAHLIFEEYVGLDIHEKLVITWKSNSNMIWPHGERQSGHSYSLPKEIYVVDDDDNDKNTGPQAPTEEPQILNKSKITISSMPSFNLLQEETDEDVAAPEIEEHRSEEVTEQTVFEHIRKKAKRFPMFSTSVTISSSPSEALIPARKASETDMNGIPRETVILPDSEPIAADISIPLISPRKMDRLDYSIDENTAQEHHIISRSLINGNAELSAGSKSAFSDTSNTKACVWESFLQKASPSKEQQIPWHVMSRNSSGSSNSKYFMDTTSTVADQTDVKEPFSDNQLKLSTGNSYATARMQIENSAMPHQIFPRGSVSNVQSEQNVQILNDGNDPMVACKKLFSAAFVKEAAEEGGPKIDLPLKEQQISSKEPNAAAGREVEKLCSTVAGQQNEVSFLGFKSVFSFL